MFPFPIAVMSGGGPPSGLGLSITDPTPEGSGSGASETGFVTSNSTTVSVISGGTGSYTYAWTLFSGPADSGPYNAILPTAATTAWNDTVSDLDGNTSETWECLVTDTGNARTGTITCVVNLVWTDIT